jgi:hypothetical protein
MNASTGGSHFALASSSRPDICLGTVENVTTLTSASFSEIGKNYGG